MADFEGYDPHQADYDISVSNLIEFYGGMIMLTAFGSVGYAVALTPGTSSLGQVIIIDGIRYVGYTEGQLAIIRLIATGALDSVQAQTYLGAHVATFGEAISAGGLMLLDQYNHEFNNYDDYQDFIDYLENQGATCWGTPEEHTYCIF